MPYAYGVVRPEAMNFLVMELPDYLTVCVRQWTSTRVAPLRIDYQLDECATRVCKIRIENQSKIAPSPRQISE